MKTEKLKSKKSTNAGETPHNLTGEIIMAHKKSTKIITVPDSEEVEW